MGDTYSLVTRKSCLVMTDYSTELSQRIEETSLQNNLPFFALIPCTLINFSLKTQISRHCDTRSRRENGA